LLASLNDQGTLHAGGLRTQTAHHSTLSDAIRWSYDLLSEEEKRLFARLSVFAGGFTFASAEETFASTFQNNSVTELIISLADKSLVLPVGDIQGTPRFNMLITIQQFALQRLHESGEEAAARDQHQVYFLNLAMQSEREIHGPGQVEWMDRVELEINNFRLAFEWSLAEKNMSAAITLIAALGWTVWMQGHGSEVQSWFDKIRLIPGIDDYPVEYARMLNQLGFQNWMKGDFREARTVLEESRVIGMKAGSDIAPGLAQTFLYQGLVRWIEGDFSAAEALFMQSQEIYQKLGDQWGMAYAMLQRGNVATSRNENDRALPILEESYLIFRRLGDFFGISRSSQRLGELFLRQGDFEKASQFFEQQLKNDEKLHFNQGISLALHNLGELSRYQGDVEKAEQYFKKSLAISSEFGDEWSSSNTRINLGLTALYQNDYPRAKRWFSEGFYKEWLVEREFLIYDMISGLAAVAAGMKQPERAAKLSGAAQSILARTDYRPSSLDESWIERHIQIARQQIGEEAFNRYRAQGRQMTLEQAVAYAFENEG
ncbi:MAG: tetratricopeptide repeat protein, partial [Omnitrophica WOR_2 bacterium]